MKHGPKYTIYGKRDTAYPPRNKACVYQVWPMVDGLGAVDNFYIESVDHAPLGQFLERGSLALSPCGPVPAFSDAGVKVVFLETRRINHPLQTNNHIGTTRAVFEELIHALRRDPLSINMLGDGYALFEHWGGLADGDIATVHFRAPSHRSMWSLRQLEHSSSFDTRCVIILKHGYNASHHRVQSVLRDEIVDCLEAFKQDVHSPLYLPFALSVQAFRECRYLLDTDVENILTTAECPDTKELGSVRYMNGMTAAYLGRTLHTITTTLDSIETMYQYLEGLAKKMPPSAKSERVLESNNSILSAIHIQRGRIKSLRRGTRFAEERARNETTFVSYL